jgi:hypothetical protein
VAEEAKDGTFKDDHHVTCMTTHSLALKCMTRMGVMRKGTQDRLTHEHVWKAVRAAAPNFQPPPPPGEMQAKAVAKVRRRKLKA